ncbi:hypothetical protein HOY34_09560 [Xinfangfangia sp. D13-10-4-6]|uniref:hypothetical protein n=1 Tax=Pseudogemmobacter hezensis TaxID=2737662 RepID=UPI001552067E|nr:hypothetical protein [Pseudogemmobacter hezensis]NPD15446.1 hypothetical protein [Pseudogemmobacter hezensis]
MNHRKSLLQGATVQLYMGPLLAGLAGFGPALLPPFIAIFMLWLVLLRPHRWPQSGAEWLKPDALLLTLTLLVSQTLFVAVLFGVGRGLGGVLGYLPIFHPTLPLCLSLLALPLMRLVWSPELALENDETIDQDLWAAAQSGEARPAVSAQLAMSELFALSERGRADAGQMLDALDHYLDTGDIWSRLAVLAASLDTSPANEHVALRRAVILKSTDPLPQSQFAVPGEIRTAFAAAGTSDDLLALLALRGRALLQKQPSAAHYFPPRAVVTDLAANSAGGTAALALADLAAELAKLVPEPPNAAQKNAATRPASGAASGPRGFAAKTTSA